MIELIKQLEAGIDSLDSLMATRSGTAKHLDLARSVRDTFLEVLAALEHLTTTNQELMAEVARYEEAAFMFPSDLEKFKTREMSAEAYSVSMGKPGERSVPLYVKKGA
jgi:hypothetical protein